MKGWLRRRESSGNLGDLAWARRAGSSSADAELSVKRWRVDGFEAFWSQVAEASPKLRARGALRPSDLPRQIQRAAMCLRALRNTSALNSATNDRVDIADLAISRELADA
jgi:hypothetical protein